MSRSNIYVLRNLHPAKKLGISLGLLLGLSLFSTTFLASVAAVSWDLSWMALLNLGTRVGMLGDDWRWLLLVAHVVSLASLLPLSLALMRRMPLPR